MTEQPHHQFNESDFQNMLDSMFVAENEELLEKLREQIKHDEELEELSKAIGIEDKELVQSLMDLGITAHSMAALTMYPMVCVAYADGVLNIEERDLIMKMASEWNMKPGDAGFEVLNHWLVQGPTEDGFAVWKKYIQTVMTQMTPQQIADLKLSIMSRSNAVATAVGDVLGRFGNRTNKAEDARLAEIESVFP
ncbi:hypothetical protein Pan97_43950 [Bremerella volcania]|uniref:Tellurite resistance protein TerB n=1 Tax=Bremerella volcania TaxID=2527984 RepID=A0A518CDM7_9BACT|nr:hypothetical protein [Bremerella volcania]QDU77328.1 hypothetical protein Pan97_43950 [Bremerella volcania]